MIAIIATVQFLYMFFVDIEIGHSGFSSLFDTCEGRGSLLTKQQKVFRTHAKTPFTHTFCVCVGLMVHMQM